MEELIKKDIESFIMKHKQYEERLHEFYENGPPCVSIHKDGYKEFVLWEDIQREFLNFILSRIEFHYEQSTGKKIPGQEVMEHFNLPELVSPMIRSLFKESVQKLVLSHVMDSIVILHRDNIHESIKNGFSHDTVDIISIYVFSFLYEIPVPFLTENIVGKNIEKKSFVSYNYFKNNKGIDDFIIHETAHFFHNNRASDLGITGEDDEKILLDIEFEKRETFAFAMELFTKIKYFLGKNHNRENLLRKLEEILIPVGKSKTIKKMVREALNKRNGWKYIAECYKKRI